ncbi:MAG TPA: adenylate/guanylate cyclase domain-containing protein, partial [Solirubrobacteraceae bacterium]|nr:adenylate/guanylate cyclase domain-containing protein [Solirubrobacteraceae bacterium]
MADDDTGDRRSARRLAALARSVDEHPLLLRLAKAARRRLPGDDRYGDPLSLDGDEAPGLLGQRLALVAAERPSALKEVGFSALQVWQSLSEAQGRGRGDEEVTILFTDLCGFSSWALEVGDAQAVELLRRVANAVETPVRANRGRVVKRLGDGLMAAFADPEDAVAAAAAASAGVATIELDGYRPKLRAGVHVGRPRRLGGDYFGVDVNTAARIAA